MWDTDMDTRTETQRTIADVEARLVGLGWNRRSIALRLCHAADINPTTWRRWRKGETEPTAKTWRKVKQELANIEGGLTSEPVVRGR